jgi:hypothetical protein
MLTLRKIENVPTGQSNRPKLVVKIVGEYWCDHTIWQLTGVQSAEKCSNRDERNKLRNGDHSRC